MASARSSGSPSNSTAIPAISTRAERPPAAVPNRRNSSTRSGTTSGDSLKALLPRTAARRGAGKGRSLSSAPGRDDAGPVQADDRLPAEGGPAGGDPQAGRGAPPGPEAPGPARRHGERQDLHDGQGDRGGRETDPRPVAQQDAGGAALPGVPQVLPGKRRGVLRLLLRLLPAGGLRPAERHLHREGGDD